MNSSFIHTQKYHNIQTCIICIKLQFYQQFSLSRNKITKQFLRTNSDLIETLNVKRCLTLMDCLFENANVFMYFGLASTLKRSKTENCYKQCFENENRSLSTVERPFKIGFRKRWCHNYLFIASRTDITAWERHVIVMNFVFDGLLWTGS